MSAVARLGTAGRRRTATWNGPRLVAGGIRFPFSEVTLRRPDPAGGSPGRDDDGGGGAADRPSRPGFLALPRGFDAMLRRLSTAFATETHRSPR
ncbi:hypothetical protein AB0I28_28400 [Phytomonospora sp. NPDC050363]|uniref:hypothetical protein n=1 Tax=Phytomonospora sp. NPDC050363 TaxID=3155642 RepID=UPI0033DB08C7